jgi:hypothetical protein
LWLWWLLLWWCGGGGGGGGVLQELNPTELAKGVMMVLRPVRFLRVQTLHVL